MFMFIIRQGGSSVHAMLPPGKFTPSVEFNVLEFHLNISLWERERERERDSAVDRDRQLSAPGIFNCI